MSGLARPSSRPCADAVTPAEKVPYVSYGSIATTRCLRFSAASPPCYSCFHLVSWRSSIWTDCTLTTRGHDDANRASQCQITALCSRTRFCSVLGNYGSVQTTYPSNATTKSSPPALQTTNRLHKPYSLKIQYAQGYTTCNECKQYYFGVCVGQSGCRYPQDAQCAATCSARAEQACYNDCKEDED